MVAYFFETSLTDAIRRNHQRAGKQKIPVPAIAGTLRKLQVPTLEEGYDEIRKVTLSPDGVFVVSRCDTRQRPQGGGGAESSIAGKERERLE